MPDRLLACVAALVVLSSPAAAQTVNMDSVLKAGARGAFNSLRMRAFADLMATSMPKANH